jgi:hypothetical protein
METNEVALGASYCSFRMSLEHDATTDGQWCGQRGIDIQRLNAWKRAHPDTMKKLLEWRRERYAQHLSEVDQALIDKAKGGDTRAAELLYRRFEGWTPKAAEEALKKRPDQKTFAELVNEGGE